MSSKKHSLTEVLCGFWFDPKTNPWDSTFFGEYYECIKGRGYDEKQEQKGFQFQFEINAKAPLNSQAITNEIEMRMLFKNKTNNSAIILAPHYISIHKLAPYESWEKFRDTEVVPSIKNYNEIGLGTVGLKQVQMLYLNKYEFNSETELAEVFKFLPGIKKLGIGKEKSLIFQSQYEFEPNLLMQIKLNAVSLPDGNKEVILECSCLATSLNSSDSYLSLAEHAHEKNNEVFHAITT